jgi:surface protein
MKTINTYIFEKLILKKTKYKYCPETKEELNHIIFNIINENNNELIDFNDIDVSNITDMDEVFESLFSSDTKKITKIDVSDWDVSNVTTMCGLFASCDNIEEIKGLENWDVSNVVDMSEMFWYCKSLKEIDISNWDVKKVKNLEEAFYRCNNLTSIGDVSKWELESLTEDKAQHVFSGCKNLVCDIRPWSDYFDTTKTVYKCNNISI